MNKKVKKTLVIITSMFLITNITGCNNSKNIEPYTINSENWVDVETWESILSMSDNLMNLRYTGYNAEQYDGYADLLDSQTYEVLRSILEDDTTSEYYDIEDIYQSEVDLIRKKIEAQGGSLSDDLIVTYNGVPQENTPESGVQTESNEEIPEAETSKHEADVVQAPEDVESSEIEETSTEETSIENTEAYESVASTDGVESSESENGIETSESSEVDYYEEEEIVDPRATDLYDLKGIKIWSAKSQGEIDNMTDEENAEFDKLYQELQDSYTKHYRGVVDKIEIAKNEELEDTGESDLPEQEFKFNRDEALAMTSDFIQIVDGHHVISWNYIIDHYNHETGRLNFNVLGANKYIDVTEASIKLSPFTYIGDEAYNFERTKYELLDNKLVNIEYASYIDGGTLKYNLVLCGQIVDGKLKLDQDNIRKIVDLYQ